MSRNRLQSKDLDAALEAILGSTGGGSSSDVIEAPSRTATGSRRSADTADDDDDDDADFYARLASAAEADSQGSLSGEDEPGENGRQAGRRTAKNTAKAKKTAQSSSNWDADSDEDQPPTKSKVANAAADLDDLDSELFSSITRNNAKGRPPPKNAEVKATAVLADNDNVTAGRGKPQAEVAGNRGEDDDDDDDWGRETEEEKNARPKPTKGTESDNASNNHKADSPPKASTALSTTLPVRHGAGSARTAKANDDDDDDDVLSLLDSPPKSNPAARLAKAKSTPTIGAASPSATPPRSASASAATDAEGYRPSSGLGRRTVTFGTAATLPPASTGASILSNSARNSPAAQTPLGGSRIKQPAVTPPPPPVVPTLNVDIQQPQPRQQQQQPVQHPQQVSPLSRRNSSPSPPLVSGPSAGPANGFSLPSGRPSDARSDSSASPAAKASQPRNAATRISGDRQSAGSSNSERLQDAQRRIVELERQLAARSADLSSVHSQELDNMRRLMAETAQSHKISLQAEQQRHQQLLTETDQRHQQYVEQLAAAHRKELDELRSSHLTELQRIRQQHLEELQAKDARHREEIASIQHHHAQQTATAMDTASNAQTLKQLLERLQASADEVTTLQMRLDQLSAAQEQSSKASIVQREEALKASERTLLEQRAQLDQERGQMQALMTKMEAEMRQHRAQAEQQTWKLSQEAERLAAQMQSLEIERGLQSEQVAQERREMQALRSALSTERREAAADIQEQRRALAQDRAELKQQKKLLEQRERRQQELMAEKTAALEETAAQLQHDHEDLRKREKRLRAMQQSVEKTRQQLQEKQSQLDADADRLLDLATEMQSRSALLDRKDDELRQAAQTMQSELTTMTALRNTLAAERDEMSRWDDFHMPRPENNGNTQSSLPTVLHHSSPPPMMDRRTLVNVDAETTAHQRRMAELSRTRDVLLQRISSLDRGRLENTARTDDNVRLESALATSTAAPRAPTDLPRPTGIRPGPTLQQVQDDIARWQNQLLRKS